MEHTNKTPNEGALNIFLNRAIFIFLLGSLFLEALAVNPWGYNIFEVPKFTLLLLLDCFLALLIPLYLIVERGINQTTVTEGIGPLKKNLTHHLSIVFPIIPLIIVNLLAFLTSIDHRSSFFGSLGRFDGLLAFISYVVIFLVSYAFVTDNTRRIWLAITIVAAGTLSSTYAISQHFGLDFFSWSTSIDTLRSFSFQGSPIHFGAFLTLGLPLVFSGLLFSKNSLYRLLLSSILTLMFSALIFSYARAAWLGLFFAFFAMSIIAVRILSRQQIIQAAFYAFLAMLVSLVFLASSSTFPLVKTKVQTALALDQGSSGARLAAWKESFFLSEELPLTGFGQDTYELKFSQIKPPYWESQFPEGNFDKPHNYFLELFLSLGPLGLVAFLWIMCFALLESARGLLSYSRKEGLEPLQNVNLSQDGTHAHTIRSLFRLGGLGIIISYSFQLAFSFSMIGSAPIFWALLGALFALKGSDLLSRDSGQPTNATAMAEGSGTNKKPSVAGTVQARSATVFNEKPDLVVKRMLHYFGALLFAFTFFTVIFLATMSLRPLLADYWIKVARLTEEQDLARSVAYYQKAYTLAPYEHTYLTALGRAYLTLGVNELKISYVNRSIEIFKESRDWVDLRAESHSDLGTAYLKREEVFGGSSEADLLGKALLSFKKAVELEPNSAKYHYLLGLTYLRLNEPHKALTEWEKTVEINPHFQRVKTDLEILKIQLNRD